MNKRAEMKKMKKRRGRVLKGYRSAYGVPVVLKKGDEVTAERKISEWDGWLWCTTANGREGWVPEKYLKICGSQGEALRNYNGSELTVGRNDYLEILEEESGWFWCRTESGNYGWIPKDHVEIGLRKAGVK